MRTGIESIRYFRRAIRGEYKETLDSLMEKAHKHEDIVVLGAALIEILFLSVLLDHMKEIVDLRSRSMK